MHVMYKHVIWLIFSNIFMASCQQESSLTFVIDNTRSMADDIRHVKQSAEAITKIVFEEISSQIKNMVLVTFNDPYVRLAINTQDRDHLIKHINNITARNLYTNWDCEEPSMGGIYMGLKNSLPGSYIYVFTDASAKDYWKSRHIKNLCQKKQSQVTFILTGKCYGFQEPGFQVYYDIASACSGLVFYVPKSEVRKVLSTIKETISGNKTVLTSIVVPANKYSRIPFTIDEQTEYAVVSVSGSRVTLSIDGPQMAKENLIWLDNAKVIKLSDPTPGGYTAIVQGHTETSVYIVGRTDFLFKHGFSELEPRTLNDTTPQPIANTNTHLSVVVFDPKHTVNITFAQILDMDEKVLILLPLKRVAIDFYTSTLFVVPLKRFKVAVQGTVVRNGKPIRRIAKIPVTAQDPRIVLPKSKNPVVTISEGKLTQVDYDKTVKLTCRVLAYPEPVITWKNNLNASLKSQSSLVEFPYDYISYLTVSNVEKSDAYSCHATNKKGTELKTIEVIVKEPFELFSSHADEAVFSYGEKATLMCDIRAPVPMHISWSYTDIAGTTKEIVPSNKYKISTDSKMLTIPYMDLEMVGNYSCKATLDKNPNKFKIFSTRVKIGDMIFPTATGLTVINTSKDSTVGILCNISGLPQPTISWQFMGSDASEFVPVQGSDAVLRISAVNEKHAGRYKCVAHNVMGAAEHITVLSVMFAPIITSKQTSYISLERDIVLRIPCDTAGVPAPGIAWKVNGTTIEQNTRYSIIDGALLIKYPKTNDSGSYTCMAENALGTAEATFKADVDENLEDYGIIKEIHILKDTSKKLECGSGDPNQSVRWFIDGVDLENNKTYFDLENVDLSKDGNYTCRVSDMNGSYSLTYRVIVGYAPVFDFGQTNTVVDWNGSDEGDGRLDCQFSAKPTAEVVWTYNGIVLSSQHSFFLPVSGNWGHYSCNVTNVYGSVQKNFDVISTNCLIKRKPKEGMAMPFILTPESTWPVLESTKKYLTVAPGQKLIFACPNHPHPKGPVLEEMLATCDKQDTFVVNGKNYKVSDLQCTRELKPLAVKTHEKCLTETSDVIRVGYDVHGFLETYEVCFDTSKNMPLYTRVLMSKSNLGEDVTHSWSKYPGIGDGRPSGGYNCTDVKSTCCYSKTQLVNARDFSDGPAQRSTYIDPLNAVPYWRPCDEVKDPWGTIENGVRSQLSDYSLFIAWSGVQKLEEKNGQTIPRYLWKVLRFDEEEIKAVVYVNGPSPTNDDILCTNKCDDVPWLKVDNDHIYCCEVDEFLQAFGLRGTTIGESIEGALVKIRSKKI